MQTTTQAADAVPPQPDAPPELITSLAWPPRIMWTEVPLLTRLRDVALTTMAWALYLLILRKPIVNCIEWMDPFLGRRLKEVIPVDYAVDTAPYLWIASVLVLVLIVTGLSRRTYLGRVPSADYDVPPLPPEAQFDAAGVPAEQRAIWRNARRLKVRHDSQGRAAAIDG